IPDRIAVRMVPRQLSPGERFNLSVRPLINGSLMTGLSGHTQIYVNGELVYNESSTLESTFGETFPGPKEFEGFAYGDWRIVFSSHGVRGSTSFEVVRKGQDQGRTVVLKPGWNMVSFRHPVRLGAITDDCRVDTFQGSRVWTFSDGWSHPRVMEPTRSYYLHASSRCVAHVEGGSGTASTSTTDSISLEEGWNMISLPGSMQASLSSISGSCDIRDYRGTPVWNYDPDLGWQQFGMSRPLKSTDGYFVNVASDCSLRLGTSTPPTPGDTGGEEEDVPLAGEWKYEQAATCKFRGKGSGYRCTSDAEFDANGGYWCECVNLTWVRYH
ncbi:MAG: hypothetical protein SVU32_05640, partial [Candidatus Nanohaloarchaea archaeon]|nr:hypothetical protein [Candidatus Nanohaloarchaea archaeon]